MELYQKGVFESSLIRTGQKLVEDQFEIYQEQGGWFFSSRMTSKTNPSWIQTAKMNLDQEWNPIHLLVDIPSSKTTIKFKFSDREGKMTKNQGNGDMIRFFPMNGFKTMILIDRALYLPYLWLNGMDYKLITGMDLSIVPSGSAKITSHDSYHEILMKMDGQMLRNRMKITEEGQPEHLIIRNGQVKINCRFEVNRQDLID